MTFSKKIGLLVSLSSKQMEALKKFFFFESELAKLLKLPFVQDSPVGICKDRNSSHMWLKIENLEEK